MKGRDVILEHGDVADVVDERTVPVAANFGTRGRDERSAAWPNRCRADQTETLLDAGKNENVDAVRECVQGPR